MSSQSRFFVFLFVGGRGTLSSYSLSNFVFLHHFVFFTPSQPLWLYQSEWSRVSSKKISVTGKTTVNWQLCKTQFELCSQHFCIKPCKIHRLH